MILGKKVVPPAPEPAPQWRPHTDRRFEVNAAGQLRTREPKVIEPPPAAAPVDVDIGFCGLVPPFLSNRSNP